MAVVDKLSETAERLVAGIADGDMSSVAYDTSWFARLEDEYGTARFPSTLAWLTTHQHRDGSWGGHFATYHDRMISTLSAVTALASSRRRDEYDLLIHKGLAYVAENADKVQSDPYETVGFELLFPRHLEEAHHLGLSLPYDRFAMIERARQEKLASIPETWIYQLESPVTHSLEFVGPQIDVVRAKKLLRINGSVGNSPSASAFVSQYLYDPQLNGYLTQTHQQSRDGGIPNVRPFEVFEWAWVLYHLDLANLRPLNACKGVEHLKRAWRPGGVGFSAGGVLPDSDDSAMVMKVLESDEWRVPLDFLEDYRGDFGFRCFPFERNPSVSANIHLYEALKVRQESKAESMKSLIRSFLLNVRQEHAYWTDKWHVSPYYATCHAVLALSDDRDVIAPAMEWVMETQRQDGSWGLFAGTAEETAYCVLALLNFPDYPAKPGIMGAVKRAIAFLQECDGEMYPELWVGKGLYAPYAVIQSAVLSARALAGQKGV